MLPSNHVQVSRPNPSWRRLTIAPSTSSAPRCDLESHRLGPTAGSARVRRLGGRGENGAVGVTFRRAEHRDLAEIVRLLRDDSLGRDREAPEGERDDVYLRAFDAIDADARQLLIVAEQDGRVAGTLQLTFIPQLTFQGGERAQIEGVRVDRSVRRQGLGGQMIEWAVEQARERGCHLVQLTTNSQRANAVQFYESLGFQRTHEGMKLDLMPDH